MQFITQAVIRGWAIILLAVLLVVTAASLFTAQINPQYRSTSQLIVVPNKQVEDARNVLRSLETLERRTIVATYARIPPQKNTVDAAAKQLNINPTALTAYSIRSTVVPNTNIIRIDVEGINSATTAAVANALARSTSDIAKDIYRIYDLRLLSEAQPAANPVRPNWSRNILISIILGLGLGVLTAIGVESFRA